MSKMYVITTRSNAIGYKQPERIAEDWVLETLKYDVHLIMVECQFGHRPFKHDYKLDNYTHIGVHANSVTWTKEACLNVALRHVPRDAYVTWADCDIFFRNKNWVEETKHLLELYPVVNPWTHCYDLGFNGEHLHTHTSFGKVCMEGWPIVQGPNSKNAPYTFAHPGYAWSAKAEVLMEIGGLLDFAILGAGDHHMALGFLGRILETIPGNLTDGYKKEALRWQERAFNIVEGSVAAVRGTIEHRWHGSKVNRNYIGRWEILSKHKFDPREDIYRNSYGIWEITHKRKLERDIIKYFRERNEDANC